jgi:hypothetical protein
VLLRRGVDPSTTICKVHASAPAVVTMRASIGLAAQYDVMGEKFVKRKPAAGPMAGSGIGDAQSAAPAGPRNAKPSRRALHGGPLERRRVHRAPASSTTSPARPKANKKPA